jgi:hypothetical protein
MTESWRPIPGYEGAYEASDLGNIRSLNRITDRGRRWRGKVMTPTAMQNGYLIVTLWRDGKQRTRLVHRLVLMAFEGAPPHGTEGLHADADRANNALTNLSWGSHSENQYDQVRHGTHANYAAGPRTVTVSEVRAGSTEQPVEIHLAEYPGRPYKPSKSMRRVLVAAWGSDAELYVGRRMTLVGDPTVKFGGTTVGGIKIAALSHLDKRLTISLTVTKGKRAPHTVDPLPAPAPDPNAAKLAELRAEYPTATPERQAEILAERDALTGGAA